MNRVWRCTRGRGAWLFAVAAWVAADGAAARAAVRCPAPEGAEAEVAQIDGRARLQWIDGRLSREAPRMKLWNWGWAISIGGAGVGTLIAVPFVSRDSRIDYYTGAGAAAIGVAPFLLSPPKVIDDARALRSRLAAAPWQADDQVCKLLAEAEVMLVRDARNEHASSAWWAHLGNVAFNAGLTLFEGLGFHRWSGGLINGISGLAVGEAVILTQPTRTIDDLAAYNRGDLQP